MTVKPKTERREKPIIFQGWSVRGILERTKIQTRRVIKPQPNHANQRYDLPEWEMWGNGYSDHGQRVKCPYGLIGDSLWLRETWRQAGGGGNLDGSGEYAMVVYRASATTEAVRDGTLTEYARQRKEPPFVDHSKSDMRWRPSIFMPRWASRITLEITGVRVERVRDISAHDVYKEGIQPLYDDLEDTSCCIDRFQVRWNDINAKPRPVRRAGEVVGWASYPWSLTTFLSQYGDKVHQFEEGAWSYRPGRVRRPVVEEEFLPLAIHDNPWVWVVEFMLAEGDGNDR